ncbi:MAG: STAS domain-containing protein [Solirubrobacteraceae bacterium]
MNDKHPALDIIEVLDAGRIRVCLRGELDLASAPGLGETLRRLRDRHASVLLDLDEVSFIDMSGLRVVLEAAEQASADGGAFAVTRGSARVRRLIALVQPDGQLPLDGNST